MLLNSIIGELLLRNNCVVIPKFGGFIATQTSANIDFVSGKMSAPKKSILFNKQLTNSDGLLVSALATKEQISFEEASLLVEKEVKIWLDILNEGERVSFENVGFIYLDNEKNLKFEQDRFFNLLLQSFGMGQINFIAEQEKTVVEKVIPLVETKILQEESPKETPIIRLVPEIKLPTRKKEETQKIVAPQLEKEKKSSKYLIKYIAAACILPIAFYSVWIPAKTDVLESGMLSFQDFNPFHKGVKSTYSKEQLKETFGKVKKQKSFEEITANVPSSMEIFPMEFDNQELGEENDIFYVQLHEKEIIKPIIESTTATKPIENVKEVKDLKINTAGKIKVIAGSFSNEYNAEELVNLLKSKGFGAFSTKQENGLIRVIASTGNSANEADSLVQKLTSLQVPSWISK